MLTNEYMEREKQSIYTTTVVSPPVLHKGKGVWFKDLDGKKYMDFTSQICLLNTGYNPPSIVRAIKCATENVHSCISADYPFCFEWEGHEISRAALAEKLIKISDKIMPGRKKKVMFETSGATIVNAAGILAAISYLRSKKIHGIPVWTTNDFEKYFFDEDILIPSHYDPFRFAVLGFKKAFHGRHGLAKLLTCSKPVHLWGLSSGFAIGRLNLPRHGDKKEEIIKEAGAVIKTLSDCYTHQQRPVAFFFEPIQGEGGVNVPDPKGINVLINFLRDEHGIPIIADEIQSGLGRTGKMFACEHFGIQPDMVLLSKSLAAGLPLGALVADVDKFPDLEPGMHSGSMHCTPTACAAAIANLKLIEKVLAKQEILSDESSVSEIQRKGDYVGAELIRLQRKYSHLIKEIRGIGLMLGIEFHDLDIKKRVVKKAGEEGLLLAGCGEKTIRFYPPIIATRSELAVGMYLFEKALKASRP